MKKHKAKNNKNSIDFSKTIIEKNWDDIDIFTKMRSKVKYPFITISKKKTITLSSGFITYAQENIEGKTHIILSFSKSKNAIVFNFTDNSNDIGAIKMTIKTNSTISCRSFFNHYNIDIEKYFGIYKSKIENIPNHGERWVVFLDEKEV